MTKTELSLWKTIEDNLDYGLGFWLGLGFFYFILSLHPLSGKLYLERNSTLLGWKKI